MSDRTLKQIRYYKSRIERYPDGDNVDFMEAEISRLIDEHDAELKAGPPSRIMNRVQALISGIRKMKRNLQENPTHAKVPVWEARISEYQQGLANVSKFGVERPKPEQLVGVKINVPTDVMEGHATEPEVGTS